MALRLFEESAIAAIGSAIRDKYGTTSLYRLSEMAPAINAFPNSIRLDEVILTKNGVYSPGSDYLYRRVIVDVPEVTTSSVTITRNGVYYASEGTAFSRAIVSVPDTILSEITATENLEYEPDDGYAFSRVIVSVPTYSITSTTIVENGRYYASSATAWNTISVNVYSTAVDEFIDGSIKRFEDGSITFINDYAFHGCRNLSAISIPMCEHIGAAAFDNCSLTNVSLPYVRDIGHNAFAGCTSLLTMDIPNCERIDSHAFDYCIKLSDINMPGVTYIGSYAFSSCSQLRAVNLPMCTEIGLYGFNNCIHLSSVSIPLVSKIGNTAFRDINASTITLPACKELGMAVFAYSDLVFLYAPALISILGPSNQGWWEHYGAFDICRSLTTVSIPNCYRIGSYTFNCCYSLPTISLPKCKQLYDRAFYSCSALSEVYLGSRLNEEDAMPDWTFFIGSYAFINCSALRNVYIYPSTVYRLNSSNAFNLTPIASGSGSIYVPSSLVSAYKSAQNWSVFSSQIFAIGS